MIRLPCPSGLSQLFDFVNPIPSGEKIFDFPSDPSDFSTFWGLCQVKSSSSKKFFCQVFFEKILKFFRSCRIGAGLSSIFLEAAKKFVKYFTKKKKKCLPLYYIIFLAPCQAFFAKNFFYF